MHMLAWAIATINNQNFILLIQIDVRGILASRIYNCVYVSLSLVLISGHSICYNKGT